MKLWLLMEYKNQGVKVFTGITDRNQHNYNVLRVFTWQTYHIANKLKQLNLKTRAHKLRIFLASAVRIENSLANLKL